MTNPNQPTQTLDGAIAALMGALSDPNHGAFGTALADLIHVIDKTAGTNLSVTAAQFVSSVSVPPAAAAAAATTQSPTQSTAPTDTAPSPTSSTAAANAESLGAALDVLASTIDARASDDPKSSYTSSLLAAGVEKCAKKLGEEAVETAIAATKADKPAIAAEAADLLYHLLVLLKASNVSGKDVADILKARAGVSGLTEKANRQK